MAKGFKVVSKPPTENKDGFDIEAAKKLLQGKSIVFCLPGRGVSYIFLKNFVSLCFEFL